MNRSPTIQFLLVQLVLMVWLPAAALLLVLVAYGYDRVKFRTQSATMLTVRALSSSVDTGFLEIRSGLQALASSAELERVDLQAFHAHARAFVSASRLVSHVVLIDQRGVEVLDTSREWTGVAPVERARPELLGLLQRGDFAITNLFTGSILDRPALAAGVPRRVRGVTTHVIAAGLDPQKFLPILLSPKLPDTWIVSLVDRNSTIVARAPGSAFVGQPVGEDLRRRLADQSEDSFPGTSKEGTAVLAVFSKAPISGYFVTIGVPDQELLGPVRRTALVTLAIMLATLAVVLVAALRMSRRLAAATRDLAQAATRMGRDALASTSPFPFREADQVRLGLSIATAELQQASAERGEMHREVAEEAVAKLQAVLDAAMEPMIIHDARGIIVAANAPATFLFGAASGGLAGCRLVDFIAAPLVELLRAASLHQVRRADGAPSVEVLVNSSAFELGGIGMAAVSFRDARNVVRIP